MIKKISVIGIMFLLMISIASASVLDYYGKIEGSAEVSGPTFYASNENITGTLYKKLLINQLPFTSGEVSFIDGLSQSFGSDSLNVDSFYRPKFNFYVETKVDDTGEPRPLILKVSIWNPSTKDTIGSICESILNISSLANYTATCSGSSPLSLNPSYGFLWEIKGGTGLASITYTIYLNGNTRFEVSPA